MTFGAGHPGAKVPIGEGKRLAMSGLADAIRFLTVLKWPSRLGATGPLSGRAAPFFPVVGALVGAVLAGIDAGARAVFSEGVAAAAVLATGAWLTGGLHLDGFADTCDGAFSGQQREKVLAIMRDSRSGALAVSSVVILLLLKFSLLVSLPAPLRPGIILVMVVGGRWSMVYAAAVYPYARPDGGLGRDFIASTGRRELTVASLVSLLLFLAVLPGLYWAVPVCALIVGLGARWLANRVGGMTGDTLGAMSEVGELVFLAVLAAGSTLA